MTKTRFRIYTEYVNMHHVNPILKSHFKSFSLFHGVGVWEGQEERCLVFEVIAESGTGESEVVEACREINTINHQQCCLITVEQIEAKIITGRK